MKYKLNTAQTAIIAEAVNLFESRPTFKEYDLICNKLLKTVNKRDRPNLETLNNVDSGFEKNEVVPLQEFSIDDLPEGWALCPCYDSGNNHKVENAGTFVWRHVWNFWGWGNPWKDFKQLDCVNK